MSGFGWMQHHQPPMYPSLTHTIPVHQTCQQCQYTPMHSTDACEGVQPGQNNKHTPPPCMIPSLRTCATACMCHWPNSAWMDMALRFLCVTICGCSRKQYVMAGRCQRREGMECLLLSSQQCSTCRVHPPRLHPNASSCKLMQETYIKYLKVESNMVNT